MCPDKREQSSDFFNIHLQCVFILSFSSWRNFSFFFVCKQTPCSPPSHLIAVPSHFVCCHRTPLQHRLISCSFPATASSVYGEIYPRDSGPRILKEPLWNPGESNAVIVSPPIICNIRVSLLQMHESTRHASCTSDDRQTAPSSCCVSLMNNAHLYGTEWVRAEARKAQWNLAESEENPACSPWERERCSTVSQLEGI